MSRIPLPRFSNLSSQGSSLGAHASSSGAKPGLGDAPTTWEGIFKSAQELKQIRDATFAALESNKQGFVSLNVRPALYEIQKELERASVREFGLLGRLALCRASPSECGTEVLPLPAMVLAFAVHSAILNAGFVCTGSASHEFSENESWPNSLPQGWLDDTGSKFSFRYRLRSTASDRLVWKGVVMSDLLAISANDPYSSGKDAMTMHLRIKDFVKSKANEPPALIESKERELYSVIEDRIIPIGMPAQRASPDAHAANSYNTHPGPGGEASPDYSTGPAIVGGNPGFSGDLAPGGGGSMLFGPGNPGFDARFRPGLMDPRRGGRVPEARFDPYGPFGSRNADPDPDDFPMPGRPGMGSTFPSGPTGPRRSNLDYL